MLHFQICVASFKNGCSSRLISPESEVKDFDILWLDDLLNEQTKRSPEPPNYPTTKLEQTPTADTLTTPTNITNKSFKPITLNNPNPNMDLNLNNVHQLIVTTKPVFSTVNTEEILQEEDPLEIV